MAATSRPKLNRPEDIKVKTTPGRKRKADFSLLSDEEKVIIQRKAQEEIDRRDRESAMEEYLQAELERLDRKKHPEAHEPEEDILIDLPLYAAFALVDGRQFWHGKRYTVRASVARVLESIMAGTRKHDAEVHGQDQSNAYYLRERARLKLNMRTGLAMDGERPRAVPSF